MSRRKHRCRKVRYRDKQLALQVVRHFARNGTRDVKPIRAYQCNACNGWHITSQENITRQKGTGPC